MFAPIRPTPTKPMFMLSFSFPVMSSEAEISLATWLMVFEPIEVRDSSTSVGMTENTGSHSANIKHQPSSLKLHSSSNSSRKEWIVNLLLSYCCHRAMPRADNRLIG